MNEIEFGQLGWLNLLWVVPAAVALGLYAIWQRRRALQRFAAARVLPRIAPPLGLTRPLVRLGLVALTLMLLVAAIIDPRWGVREQTVVRRGIDIMILLDVSRSMLARDISPSRLERAKIAIADDLLPRLGGDRVGLIAFAGVATLKCPLTNDYGFFRLALGEVSPESVPRGGSLIGDAIRMAAECFRTTKGPETHKVVLLITDGEDQESFPVEAATKLWDEQKVGVVAIALGDDREGARIPIRSPGGEGYAEYKGETVWTKADFAILRQVAAVSDSSGRTFIPVGTRNFDLGEIYRSVIVPTVRGREQLETERVPLPSQYHLFAVAALACLLLDSFLRDTPRPAAAARAVRVERDAA
jgi:Ca-activated chloride channel family protein